MSENKVTMEQVMSLCKRRGFIFQGSEIYGGLANTWDYGPLGVELKNNVKKTWWKKFVTDREDMVGLDSSILMNPKVWEASGHLKNFSDPLIDCKKCKSRFRADKLIEEKISVSYPEFIDAIMCVLKTDMFKSRYSGPTGWVEVQKVVDKYKGSEMYSKMTHTILGYSLKPYINLINSQTKYKFDLPENGDIQCPNCGASGVDVWTEPKAFNLMFKTQQGVIEGEGTEIYLRPETAQGIFVNFKNVVNTTRKKIPFGIAQIGKAFRNEITPGNFTFRTREFEQMEIEYFVEPGQEKEYFEKWKTSLKEFFLQIGIKEEKLKFRDHTKDELSHYSSGTTDVEYEFPWGFGELTGLAIRTDYDLKQHSQYSGENMEYIDPYDNTKKFVPFVIEPSFGLDRTVLTILLDAYHEEILEDGTTRIVLKLDKKIAPVQVAILPLKKNEERIVTKAREILNTLRTNLSVQYDDSGSIGKLYRRQDEIGTPYCLTVDFDTIEKDDCVTIRDRDTMKQERVKVSDLVDFFKEKI